VILLFLAFKDVSLSELKESLQRANFFWVGLTVTAGLLGFMSRAYRWKLLIKPLNYNPSFWNVFYALMIGYTANFAIPRIGEITRCITLRRSDKIPVDSLLGTVLIERAWDMIVLLSIFLLIFFSKLNFFGKFFTDNIYRPVVNQFSNIFDFSILNWIFFLALLAGLYFLLKYLNRRLSGNVVWRKLRKLVRGVIRGVKTIARMKNRWVFLMHTFFIWFMYFIMSYLLVFAFPSTSHLTPLAGLILLVIGGIGMSAPVQGGIGVFHVIVALGLTELYNIPKVDAVAYATVSHESQALLAIILGGISFVMLFINKRKAFKLKMEKSYEFH
jgi:uncharacterized protein (TIRG00374 family)